VPDFVARIERDHGDPLDQVRVSLHESDYGAWRGYFFCPTKEHFRVGEIVRLTMNGSRRKTAVVYGMEALAGRQMWVVDLVGADPPARSALGDDVADQAGAPTDYGTDRTAQK
jgi:hypothetical protein